MQLAFSFFLILFDIALPLFYPYHSLDLNAISLSF